VGWAVTALRSAVMANLTELARRHTSLGQRRTEHLQRLVASWGALADLCFSDLLLFAPTGSRSEAGDPELVVLAQVRPTTSQTLYRTDWVGAVTDGSERPLVAETLANGEVLEGEIELALLQVRTRITSIPVRYGTEIVAVVSREGAVTSEEKGELQQTYEKIFDRFAVMIAEGVFPFTSSESETEDEPRVGDGVMLIDHDGQVEFMSPNAVSALHRVGIHSNPIGRRLSDLAVHQRIFAEALKTGSPVIGEVESSGNQGAVLIRCLPLVEQTRATGGLVLLRDVSELRTRDKLLVSKDATIREIHHRVKNNLQTISALLRIQGRRVDSPEAKAAISESVRRIGSIALVHEILAREAGGDVPFADIVRPLVRTVEEGLSSPDQPVQFSVIGDRVTLPAAVATPLAVVLTELMQNTVDHAYPPGLGPYGRAGEIELEVGEQLRVWVRDDGVGPGEDFSVAQATGLGLSIVRTLVESELGGTIEIRRRYEDRSPAGTMAELVIPLPAQDTDS